MGSQRCVSESEAEGVERVYCCGGVLCAMRAVKGVRQQLCGGPEVDCPELTAAHYSRAQRRRAACPWQRWTGTHYSRGYK